MKKTNITVLVASGAFVAAAAAILTYGFYSDMPPLSAGVAAMLWLVAAVCAVMARVVRRNVGEGTVGFDRSQMSPIAIANWLAIGRASAWTGSIAAGAYIGIGLYVVPKAAQLVSAGEDLPAVLLSAAGGIGLSAAGLWLERSCEVPPIDGEPAA